LRDQSGNVNNVFDPKKIIQAIKPKIKANQRVPDANSISSLENITVWNAKINADVSPRAA
jgi:hypothetical protein